MSNKVFVGGLSWSTSDQGLREAFAACGAVTEAKVVTDRETGRSRGFGFVTYANAADAQNALQLDGKMLDGRTIRVDLARDNGRDGPRRTGGPGGGGEGRGGPRGERSPVGVERGSLPSRSGRGERMDRERDRGARGRGDDY